MGRMKHSERPGYAKLLDAWTGPDDARNPIGCVATSFTFSSAFFEEECLARFLQVESDPAEDGPVYLVEREEKLANLICATALVDQHHCRGERSLRWDLIAARLPNGLLHAKVSLLVWSNWIRLIIASANLTEDGYRRNVEVFGVLDFGPVETAPRSVLGETARFLRRAIALGGSEAERSSGAAGRLMKLLDRVEAETAGAAFAEGQLRREAARVYPVFSGGDYYPTVLDQLTSLWPASAPPVKARVLSPFFDPPGAENRPASGTWGLLRKRGDATVAYYLTAEDVPGRPAVFLHAPESLLDAQPRGRGGVATELHQLRLEASRPLHAKIIALEDDRWIVNLVGSSNFTSAGLGLAKASNLEANLAYVVDTARDPNARARVLAAFPNAEKLREGVEILWNSRPDANEDSAGDLACLPAFFELATFESTNDGTGQVRLHFGPDSPGIWRLAVDNTGAVFFDQPAWSAAGRPVDVQIPWKSARPPSGFWVSWDASTAAWWPVNVGSGADLPPPEELRDLPLEALISILSSARPLHQVLAAFLRTRVGRPSAEDSKLDLDPHKRVDTSRFLLQRTRRISAALRAIRERLERPVATIECLRWRLEGPVGVLALARAIVREGHSVAERRFLIAELALELSRARPRDAPGCLASAQVVEEIHRALATLRDLAPVDSDDEPENLRRYAKSVFAGLPP